MIDSAGRRLIVILIVAFAVRLVVGEVVLSKGRVFLPDSELYWGYAEALGQRGEFQVGGAGARRTPGYSLFIVACTKLGGLGDPTVPPTTAQLRSIQIAQALLGVAVVAMVWSLAGMFLANQPWLKETAFFAALFAVFDPFSVSVGAMVLSETLFVAAFVGAVWFGAKAYLHSEGRTGFAFACGLLAGVAVLARPSGLLLAPLGLLFPAPRWGIKKTLLCASAFLLTLAPWVVRNASLYGAFVPTTLNVGESLYDGWNPEADGGSNMAFVDRRKQFVQGPATPAAELADDAYWKSAAVNWASENPVRAFELALIKLGRFWSPWPNAAEFQSPIVVLGCTAFSLVLYVATAVGVLVLWRQGRWRLLLLLLAPAVYFALLHSIFVSSVRYRAPTAPFLIVIAGVGVACIAHRRRMAAKT